MKRSRILLWACPVVAVGAIAGCGGSDGSTSTESAGTTATSTVTTATSSPQVTTFAVAFRDGKVTGDTEPSVPRGTPVEIRVTSDVDDEAHLHGYDIEKEIAAGETITFAFTADFSGKYTLEFHHHNVRILTLTVT